MWLLLVRFWITYSTFCQLGFHSLRRPALSKVNTLYMKCAFHMNKSKKKSTFALHIHSGNPKAEAGPAARRVTSAQGWSKSSKALFYHSSFSWLCQLLWLHLIFLCFIFMFAMCFNLKCYIITLSVTLKDMDTCLHKYCSGKMMIKVKNTVHHFIIKGFNLYVLLYNITQSDLHMQRFCSTLSCYNGCFLQ